MMFEPPRGERENISFDTVAKLLTKGLAELTEGSISIMPNKTQRRYTFTVKLLYTEQDSTISVSKVMTPEEAKQKFFTPIKASMDMKQSVSQPGTAPTPN